jgi:ferrous iron transport protein A
MNIASKGKTQMLSEAHENDVVRVIGFHGGRGFSENLAQLGVLPGLQVRVIAKGPAGPVIIACRGGRIAIGRGMAQRIEVVKESLAS